MDPASLAGFFYVFFECGKLVFSKFVSELQQIAKV
ncbi:hypothetical protein DET65_2885 [Sunxiuqinia elliptica]|uniref:Uncharacterized protein n=1 Tax=Sunxiuqinia elliptica TaxID=655355 RepID=A0A4R6H6I3_9BACT|nr:hypothetical protein DET52_103343 [Sunxiuqinia elliptica]TDO59594.1 hypothetical protein DET65_2885 [Sunxiuqinia elliptica]